MKKMIIAVLLLSFISIGCVQFEDPLLEAYVRGVLDKDPPAPILVNDMYYIVDITIPNNGITSLVGLQYATRLSTIRLSDNELTSVAPIANLNTLQFVDLGLNSGLSDFSPFAGDTLMKEFNASRTGITNIQFVTTWIDPWSVSFVGTRVVDISPLLSTNWDSITFVDLSYMDYLNSYSCNVVLPQLIKKYDVRADGTCN